MPSELPYVLLGLVIAQCCALLPFIIMGLHNVKVPSLKTFGRILVFQYCASLCLAISAIVEQRTGPATSFMMMVCSFALIWTMQRIGVQVLLITRMNKVQTQLKMRILDGLMLALVLILLPLGVLCVIYNHDDQLFDTLVVCLLVLLTVFGGGCQLLVIHFVTQLIYLLNDRVHSEHTLETERHRFQSVMEKFIRIRKAWIVMFCLVSFGPVLAIVRGIVGSMPGAGIMFLIDTGLFPLATLAGVRLLPILNPDQQRRTSSQHGKAQGNTSSKLEQISPSTE